MLMVCFLCWFGVLVGLCVCILVFFVDLVISNLLLFKVCLWCIGCLVFDWLVLSEILS